MHTAGGAPSLADITEQLADRFHGQIDATRIARMVRHCNRELIITTGIARPNATLQLAAQRLAPQT